MTELLNFCRYSFDIWSVGVLLCCNRKQMLFILLKTIAFHHGWHIHEWKIHKMKWNQILHRTVFALWFKAMDEFAFSVSYFYFYHMQRVGWFMTQSILPQHIHYLVIALDSTGTKHAPWKKNHIFHLFSSLLVCQCNPQLSSHIDLTLRVNKSNQVLNAQTITFSSPLSSISHLTCNFFFKVILKEWELTVQCSFSGSLYKVLHALCFDV